MKTLSIILFFGLSLLLACDVPDDPGIFRYDTEENICLFKQYHSTDGMMKLTVDSLNDSRCPLGVECFWQGEVSVYLSIGLNQVYQLELHSVIHPKDTIQNYEFELTGADPYPVYPEEIKDVDYVVKLRVSRL